MEVAWMTSGTRHLQAGMLSSSAPGTLETMCWYGNIHGEEKLTLTSRVAEGTCGLLQTLCEEEMYVAWANALKFQGSSLIAPSINNSNKEQDVFAFMCLPFFCKVHQGLVLPFQNFI